MRSFMTVVGTWPWQWVVRVEPQARPTPPPPRPPAPPPRLWKLVDWIAEDAGLSRGKARRAIALGRVRVDDVVELDADRMLPGSSKVELCPS